MLKLKEATDLFTSFTKSPELISESIRCSTLVAKAYEDKSISHYAIAKKLGCNEFELCLNIINTRYWKSVDDHGGITLGPLDVHKVCLHLSDAYKQAVELGKVGLIIYTIPELNKLLGYPEECVYPELKEKVEPKK